ncbi:MAG: glycosyltransferase family 2 protein [Elusimicrobia bacterium]|nr:glycosyltransferase family 2 protein [Elusimicrobiota bacterium]
MSAARIVVIAPVFNEVGKIGRAVAKVPRSAAGEVVVVSDASDDGSDEDARKAGATVLRHERTMGVGAAIRTGLKYGLEKGYDILVVMAGNDKDDPTEIPKLVAPILQEGADYVQGSRYAVGGVSGKMPLHRVILTRAYPWLVRLVTGYPITDATNGFRAIKASFLRDPRVDMDQVWLDRGELEYYLQLKALMLGFKVAEVPVRKIYPDLSAYKNYTKIRPVYDWLRNLRPIFYLTLGIKS